MADYHCRGQVERFLATGGTWAELEAAMGGDLRDDGDLGPLVRSRRGQQKLERYVEAAERRVRRGLSREAAESSATEAQVQFMLSLVRQAGGARGFSGPTNESDIRALTRREASDWIAGLKRILRYD